MMKLNTDEKRSLQFDVRIEGIDYKELQGSVKFNIDDVEYGFPVKILEDHIAAEVPPLDEIVKKGLENGKEVECKLEVFGDGFYLKPWDGAFKLATPVRVEAKMRADDRPAISETKEDKKDPVKSITATLIEEDEVQPAPVSEEVTDADLMDRLKTLLFEKKDEPKKVVPKMVPPPPEDEVIIDPKEKKVVESPQDKVRKRIEEKVALQLKKKGIVNQELVRKVADKVIKESANVKPKKKAKKVQEIKTDSKPADVYEFMASKGMTSKKSQKSLIEIATKMGGDDEAAIFNTVEKLLSFEAPSTTFQEYSKTQTMKGMED